MDDCVLCYRNEAWAMRQEKKRNLIAAEMDYLCRNIRISEIMKLEQEQQKLYNSE